VTEIKFKINPTWHQTGMVDSYTGRAYLVAETPANLLIRLKGTRQVLKLPWGMAYLRAAYTEAARLRMEKMNAKKAARKAKGK
jgi:hypothetical protein